MKRSRILIMGAAGRDFHNFNVFFRRNPYYEVVAFTAAQIPNIAERKYPSVLAGWHYPDGIPIYPEEELEHLVGSLQIDQVVFSYSDISHVDVMHKASRAIARGADFRLLGPRATMLRSTKLVISVCAVRTGCGKSPLARKIAGLLQSGGLRVAVVRHPMPYGDLSKQAAQRFASFEDLQRAECTIEEREEYEPHIEAGHNVYAGVDYEQVLRLAEAEADVLLWDGGNNDLPFFAPDLEIVVLDPHRAGDERAYFPGEVNFLRAHVLVLAKLDTADPERVTAVRQNITQFNPEAIVVESRMPVTADKPGIIKGRRVLVVEDGPTLTHGGMRFGAGVLAVRQHGASRLVDPRPFAVGSIRATFQEYPHLENALPATGYSQEQLRELEESIRGTPCDIVVVATPVDLCRQMTIRQPTCRVTYEFEEIGQPKLAEILERFLQKRGIRPVHRIS